MRGPQIGEPGRRQARIQLGRKRSGRSAEQIPEWRRPISQWIDKALLAIGLILPVAGLGDEIQRRGATR
ncbi:hypothetical protein ACQPZ2_43460 [Nocardia pseudovaccinii]|uniref:hypothetical protein n=1 Tax=Nocardia pseudovaccinii TaxID=189540 RepID=UPI003D8B2942